MNSGVDGAGEAGAGLGAGGFGPGVGRGPGVAGEAAGFSASAGLGAGGLGAAGPGRAACAGEGVAGPEGAGGLGAACLRGAPGLAADLPLPPPCWNASVSLRTTGASIVEDAERTNSPSSVSLAMTTLLSTPNSLASSYTRTLATSLLLGPGYAGPSLLHGRTHRVLIECSSQSRPTSNSRGTKAARGSVRPRLTVLPLGQLSRQPGARPPCRAAPGHERPVGTPGGGPPGPDRPGRGVHTHPGRAAYREDRGRRRPLSPRCAADRSWPLAPGTPHRCAQGVRGHASGQTRLSLPPRTDLTPSGQESNGYSPHTVVIEAVAARNLFPRRLPPLARYRSSRSSGCSVSGLMSMRQPVSRAARRAFCPSLPIASDSW